MRRNRAQQGTSLRQAARVGLESLEPRLLFFGTANHLEITATGLSFINSSVLDTINAQHTVQDKTGNNGDYAPYHFDGCYFNEGATTINTRLQTIVNNASPSSFNSNTMAVEFGKMLHAAEDFYAHSNWVEDGFTTIAQPGLGMWNTWSPYTVQDGAMFIEGETLAPNVSPYGAAHFSRNGHVVTVSFTNGPTYKGIISGTWVMEKDPDNIEVTHDYLNKDYNTKPMFQQAHDLAVLQVEHEFARIGALIKAQYGDAGVNKLMSTWVKPDAASQAAAASLLNTTPPPPPPPTNVATFIDKGATWKYLDNGSNQGSTWDSLGFDDSSWKSGAAQLGYGDGDEKTVVSFGGSSSNKYITTYFRKSFNVADPAAVQSLNLELLRDDGAVVYLNGTEVYRTNMPSGTIAYTTAASAAIEDTTFYSTSVNTSLLHAGNNVIAVEIHQAGPDSSDISFDFDLKGTTTSDPTPISAPMAPTGLAASAVSSSRIDLSWTDTSDNESNFILERSLTGTGGWSQIATPAANATSYSDTGLSASTHYFYRLRATNAGGDSGNSAADATTSPAPTPPTSGPVTYIAMGGTWKFLDNGSNQGTLWRGTGFDDSAWKSGAAQLGYGDGDEKTVVGYGGNASAKYITTYFRKTFNVADPSQVSNLALKILRDDGAVVYLNGTEVYRTNMPTGTIGYTTLASAAIEDTTFYSATINSALLVAGNNVIAVEIHQGDKTSSDISFDFSLSATVTTTTASASTLVMPTTSLSTTTTTTTSSTKVIGLVTDPTKPLI
jgi:hypothetical protein